MEKLKVVQRLRLMKIEVGEFFEKKEDGRFYHGKEWLSEFQAEGLINQGALKEDE